MIRHYSEFVTHPVFLREVKTIQVPKEKEETAESDEEKKDDIDDIEDVEEIEEEEEKEPEMEEVTTYEYEHINTDPAIWARDKDEITDEEYQEFWKVVSKEGGDAADWSHFNAE
jgi:heat shock protein beta